MSRKFPIQYCVSEFDSDSDTPTIDEINDIVDKKSKHFDERLDKIEQQLATINENLAMIMEALNLTPDSDYVKAENRKTMEKIGIIKTEMEKLSN